MIYSRDDRTYKPRPEPLLIQTARHQIRQRLRTDVPLFAQSVHVDFIPEGVADSLDVCGEASETEVDGRGVREDLGEVVGYREGLQAEAEVAGYGDAVFADHGDESAAVDVEGGGLETNQCGD